jgi:hypothetical protein
MPLRFTAPRLVTFAAVLPLLIVPAVLPAARATQDPESPKQPKDGMVVLRACLGGATLTDVSAQAEGSGSGRTYRIAGARGLVKQLKREHAGHYEEVTGRIRGEFGPPSGRRVGTIGKVGIVIGAGPSGGDPNVPRVPEMPSFEVKSFRHLEERCPR